jgi:hypothetical protein
VLGVVAPGEGEVVGRTVGGVGDGDELVQVGVAGKAGEFGEIGFGWGPFGLAAMQERAVGILVEGADAADTALVAGGLLRGVLR